MFGIVLLVLVVVVVFMAIGAYNRLIGLKNQVANAYTGFITEYQTFPAYRHSAHLCPYGGGIWRGTDDRR